MRTENQRLVDELGRMHRQVKDTETQQFDMEEGKISLNNKLHDLEREKRCLDKEKEALKVGVTYMTYMWTSEHSVYNVQAKLSSSDEDIERLRAQMVHLERDAQRLMDTETRLTECRGTVSDQEAERRQLSSQLQMERAKAAKHCDELIQVGLLHYS